jgi:acyl carrier protein
MQYNFNRRKIVDADLATVMEVIHSVSGVHSLSPDQDFYDAGLTSVQALPLLMELEARLEISIPDDRFITARSPRALTEMIAELKKSSE